MEIFNRLHQYDLRLLSRLFSQGKKRMVIPIARALSRSGDGYLHIIAPLLLWALQADHVKALVELLALAVVIERILYWCLKNCLRRKRPQDSVPGFHSLIVAADQFSFPSGHSSGAFLLATVLFVIYGGTCTALFGWALSVALSRVILGVHFPGDTLAGALMGCGTALFAATLIGLV